MTGFEAIVNKIVSALPIDRQLVVRRELLDHLRAAFDEARARGLDEGAAAAQALEALGDVKRLRRRLAFADWGRSAAASTWAAAIGGGISLVTVAFMDSPVMAPSYALIGFWMCLAFAGRLAWKNALWLWAGSLIVRMTAFWLWMIGYFLIGLAAPSWLPVPVAVTLLITVASAAWTWIAFLVWSRCRGRVLSRDERVALCVFAAIVTGATAIAVTIAVPRVDLSTMERPLWILETVVMLVLAIRVTPLRDRETLEAAR